MGEKTVPDRPHVVVVPNSLVDQWHGELKVFFQPHTIDIFRVPTGAKGVTEFWKPGGVYDKSLHNPIFRVVICPSSVSTAVALKRDSF